MVRPEDFAEEIVIENNLDQNFIYKIALNIRRQIKLYVMCAFEEFALNKSKIMKTKTAIMQPSSISTNKKSDNKKKRNTQMKLDYFLNKATDIKLNVLLGNKKHRMDDDLDNALPSFLKNSSSERRIPNYYHQDSSNDAFTPTTNAHIIEISEKAIIINKAILKYNSLPVLDNNIALSSSNDTNNNNNNNIDIDEIKSKTSQSNSTSTNIIQLKPKNYPTKKANGTLSLAKDIKKLI